MNSIDRQIRKLHRDLDKLASLVSKRRLGKHGEQHIEEILSMSMEQFFLRHMEGTSARFLQIGSRTNDMGGVKVKNFIRLYVRGKRPLAYFADITKTKFVARLRKLGVDVQ